MKRSSNSRTVRAYKIERIWNDGGEERSHEKISDEEKLLQRSGCEERAKPSKHSQCQPLSPEPSCACKNETLANSTSRKVKLKYVFIKWQYFRPGDNTTQAPREVRVEEQPVQRFFHRVGGLLCIPGDRDGQTRHHPRLCALTAQVV